MRSPVYDVWFVDNQLFVHSVASWTTY